MKKIKSINIVHSSTRNYEGALSKALEICEINNVAINHIVPNNSEELGKVLDSKVDLILVIGGDGTMIGAIRDLKILKVPFLGINIGKLGFLTDLSLDSLSNDLPPILDGKYFIEERSSLDISVSDNNETKHSINEVVLHSGEVAKMTSFSIYQNEKLIANHKSDGLIVSTATGSTAYFYSGGGPVMYPTLDVFAIMPMFSQSSSARPLILPSNKEIQLKSENLSSAKVIIDGHNEFILEKGSSLTIEESKSNYQLIHSDDYDYFEACRQKLSWGLPIVK